MTAQLQWWALLFITLAGVLYMAGQLLQAGRPATVLALLLFAVAGVLVIISAVD